MRSKHLLSAAVCAATMMAPLPVQAACFLYPMKVVRVFAVDDASGPTHAIYVRTSSLTDHSFRMVTGDDNMVEIATTLLTSQRRAAFTGAIATCPTTGTVRDIGQLLSINTR